MRNIDVRAAKGGYGSKLALLLGTLRLDRWWFSGWLERLILRSIEQVVLLEQVHKRILKWDELPLFIEWHRKIRHWRQREWERRAAERRDAAITLQSFARGRAVRWRPPMVRSQAKSLADAVAELFRPPSAERVAAPVVQLPPSKSLDEAVDELFPPLERARSPDRRASSVGPAGGKSSVGSSGSNSAEDHPSRWGFLSKIFGKRALG